MPRPRTLTSSQIAAAALAVLDRDGPAALAMRPVAAELGVSVMGLYRYVDSRGELEGLIVQEVMGTIDLTLPPRIRWRRRVEILAERARDAVAAHPAIVPLLLTRRETTPASLRWGEAVLAALDAGGFRGARRAIAFRTVLAYTLGAVQVEHLGPLSGAGTERIAELPTDTFPLLADTAASARGVTAEEEFRAGLEIVLRGLAP
jgi:AcrR family transcriptional regulator